MNVYMLFYLFNILAFMVVTFGKKEHTPLFYGVLSILMFIGWNTERVIENNMETTAYIIQEIKGE